MATIPSKIVVSDASLLRFKSAFGKYVKSERERLQADLDILNNLNTFSELNKLVSATQEQVVRLATSELDSLTGATA